jgi:hypothetical protein
LIFSCKEDNKSNYLINNPQQTFQIVEEKFSNETLFKDINVFYDQNQYALQAMVYEKGKLEEYRWQNNWWTLYASVDFSIDGKADLRDFLFSIDSNFKRQFSQKIDSLRRANAHKKFRILSWEITSPDHVSQGKRIIYKITYQVDDLEFTIME